MKIQTTLPTIKDQAGTVQQQWPLLQNGFRVFFLGAAIFAVGSMLLWVAIYAYGMPISLQNMSIVQWHAHEMIFGYSLAVIAGF